MVAAICRQAMTCQRGLQATLPSLLAGPTCICLLSRTLLMFAQTTYSYRMALQAGLVTPSNSGDGHLRWHSKRSGDVFRTFRTAFAAQGRSAAFVAVMAVQAGSGDLQLQLLRDVHSQPADALAIAPYFGYGLNTVRAQEGCGYAVRRTFNQQSINCLVPSVWE